MSSPTRRVALAASVAAGLFLAAPALAADTPNSVVEGFNAALLDAMKNGPALGFKGRFDKLRPAFEAAFDVPFMVRFVSGAAQTDEAEAKALNDSFIAYSVAFYARNFKAFDGETFPIDGTREIPQGTLVSTRIVPKGEKGTPMNYLLRRSNGAWKIIDVFLDGTISQLATRRTDFAQPLKDGGVDGLIKLLDTKTAEVSKGD